MNTEWNRFERAGKYRDEEDGYEEIFVPLSFDSIAALRIAEFQRRSMGDEQATLADLVQEAVTEWLEREIDNTTKISIQA
jgi:hypothetical protein